MSEKDKVDVVPKDGDFQFTDRGLMAFSQYIGLRMAEVLKDRGLWCDRDPMDRLVDLDLEMIGAVECVPKGWWWTVGACSVSCHASIGPDVAHCPKDMLVAFDSGFHADLPQPSTVADALMDCCAQAAVALEPKDPRHD